MVFAKYQTFTQICNSCPWCTVRGLESYRVRVRVASGLKLRMAENENLRKVWRNNLTSWVATAKNKNLLGGGCPWASAAGGRGGRGCLDFYTWHNIVDRGVIFRYFFRCPPPPRKRLNNAIFWSFLLFFGLSLPGKFSADALAYACWPVVQ